MEGTNIIGSRSSTLPLHLQRTEKNYASRDSEDESDGLANIFPDNRRRRHKSMSKRIFSSQHHKNGNGNGKLQDQAGNSSTADTHYNNNETSSMSSLPSLSQTEQKYNRRKTRFLGKQKHQLFLMMITLAVLSCSSSFYFSMGVFTHNDGDGGFWYPVHKSKGYPPRIVILGPGHFGSSSNIHAKQQQYYPNAMTTNLLGAGLFELPANSSAIFFDDLSLETVNSAAQPEPAQEPEPSAAAAAAAAATNLSVIASPNPSATKEEKTCLPMAKWMTASYPNCNSIHEIDIHQGVLSKTYDNEEDLKFLGQGWFRDTWKYLNDNFEGSPAVVLKTLRIEREFLEEYFDLHRRDAVAMERLTFSPYVVNVFGHCGQSAINELAEGIMGGKINSLEQLNRRLRGKETDPQALFLKLQLASKVSLGLAHVHNIHVSDNSGGRSKSVQSLLYEHTDPNTTHSTTGFGRSVPTMAHYDVCRKRSVADRNSFQLCICVGCCEICVCIVECFFLFSSFLVLTQTSNPQHDITKHRDDAMHALQINPRNIAIMKDGSPKLNDFNIAEFMTYDTQTNQTCGFRSRLHEPWWRAPEEMDTSHQSFVDEKVDVYALGEVLFHILTTHGPRGKMKKERMDEVRALVKEGVRPTMWEPYLNGGKDGSLKKNNIVRAFEKAMDLCFEMDPKQRGTSIQVARVLHKALEKETSRRKTKTSASSGETRTN